MSYWAGKGLDQFTPQIKTPRPTGATAPWAERIQRAPESYGGNGVDSPAVDGKGQTTEDNRFNGKAVEQKGKVRAEQHAPHIRPTQPAGAIAPSVEWIQQAPKAYGEDRSYSPTVGARVQLRADNGFHWNAFEQEREANAINQVIQAPRNKPAPEPTAPAQPTVPRMHRTPSREPMQVSSSAESVVQTDSASGKPLVSGSSQNISPAGLPPTMSSMMKINDIRFMSNQALTANTTIGAPPTGQAAANHNGHQQSPSRLQVNPKCRCCGVM